MTVLVAGGTGHLGTAVVRELLAAGYGVTATWVVEREAERLAAEPVELVQADLFDPDQVDISFSSSATGNRSTSAGQTTLSKYVLSMLRSNPPECEKSTRAAVRPPPSGRRCESSRWRPASRPGGPRGPPRAGP